MIKLPILPDYKSHLKSSDITELLKWYFEKILLKDVTSVDYVYEGGPTFRVSFTDSEVQSVDLDKALEIQKTGVIDID